jgi:hypothetical protein
MGDGVKGLMKDNQLGFEWLLMRMVNARRVVGSGSLCCTFSNMVLCALHMVGSGSLCYTFSNMVCFMQCNAQCLLCAFYLFNFNSMMTCNWALNGCIRVVNARRVVLYALCNAMPRVFSVHSICLLQFNDDCNPWALNGCLLGWSMLGARRCYASRNPTPSVFSVHSIRLSLPLDDDLRREDK